MDRYQPEKLPLLIFKKIVHDVKNIVKCVGSYSKHIFAKVHSLFTENGLIT